MTSSSLFGQLHKAFEAYKTRYPHLSDVELMFRPGIGGVTIVDVVASGGQVLNSVELGDAPGDEFRIGNRHVRAVEGGETNYEKAARLLVEAARTAPSPDLGRQFVDQALGDSTFIPPNWPELFPLGTQRKVINTREIPAPTPGEIGQSAFDFWRERGDGKTVSTEMMLTRPGIFDRFTARKEGKAAFGIDTVGEAAGRMFDADGRIVTGIVPKGYASAPVSAAEQFREQAASRVPKSTRTLGMNELAGFVAGPGKAPVYTPSPFVQYDRAGKPIGQDQGQVVTASYAPVFPEGMAATIGDQYIAQRRFKRVELEGRPQPRRVNAGLFDGRDRPVPLVTWQGGGEATSVADWDYLAVNPLGGGTTAQGSAQTFELIRTAHASGTIGGGAGSKWFAGERRPGAIPGNASLALPLGAKDWLGRYQSILGGLVSTGRTFAGLEVGPDGGIPWTEKNLPAIRAAMHEVVDEYGTEVDEYRTINRDYLPFYDPYIVKDAAGDPARMRTLNESSVRVRMRYPMLKDVPSFVQASREGAWRWKRPAINADTFNLLNAERPGLGERLSRESWTTNRLYGEPFRLRRAIEDQPVRLGTTVDGGEFDWETATMGAYALSKGDEPSFAQFSQALGMTLEASGQSGRSSFLLKGKRRTLALPSLSAMGFLSGLQLQGEDGAAINTPSAFASAAWEVMAGLGDERGVSLSALRRYRKALRSLTDSPEMFAGTRDVFPRQAVGGAMIGDEVQPVNMVSLDDEGLTKMFRLKNAEELALVKENLKTGYVPAYGYRAPKLGMHAFQLGTVEMTQGLGSQIGDRTGGRPVLSPAFAGLYDSDWDKDSGAFFAGSRPIFKYEGGKAVGMTWSPRFGEPMDRETMIRTIYNEMAERSPGKIATADTPEAMMKAISEARGIPSNELAKWGDENAFWGKGGLDALRRIVDRTGEMRFTGAEASGAHTWDMRAGSLMGIAYNMMRQLLKLSNADPDVRRAGDRLYQPFLDREQLGESGRQFMNLWTGWQAATMGLVKRWSPRVKNDEGFLVPELGSTGGKKGGGRTAALGQVISSLVGMMGEGIVENPAQVAKLLGRGEDAASALTGVLGTGEDPAFQAIQAGSVLRNQVGSRTLSLWDKAKDLGPLPLLFRAMKSARWNLDKAPMGEADRPFAELGDALQKGVNLSGARFKDFDELNALLEGQAIAPYEAERYRRMYRAQGLPEGSGRPLSTLVGSLSESWAGSRLGPNGGEFPAYISRSEAAVLEGLRQMEPGNARLTAMQIGREPRFTPNGTSLPSFDATWDDFFRPYRDAYVADELYGGGHGYSKGVAERLKKEWLEKGYGADGPKGPEDAFNYHLSQTDMKGSALISEAFGPTGRAGSVEEDQELNRLMRAKMARDAERYGPLETNLAAGQAELFQQFYGDVLTTGKFSRADWNQAAISRFGEKNGRRMLRSNPGMRLATKTLSEASKAMRGNSRMSEASEAFDWGDQLLMNLAPTALDPGVFGRSMDVRRAVEESNGRDAIAGVAGPAGADTSALLDRAFLGLAKTVKELNPLMEKLAKSTGAADEATTTQVKALRAQNDDYLKAIRDIGRIDKLTDDLGGSNPDRRKLVQQALMSNRLGDVLEAEGILPGGRGRRGGGGGADDGEGNGFGAELFGKGGIGGFTSNLLNGWRMFYYGRVANMATGAMKEGLGEFAQQQVGLGQGMYSAGMGDAISPQLAGIMGWQNASRRAMASLGGQTWATYGGLLSGTAGAMGSPLASWGTNALLPGLGAGLVANAVGSAAGGVAGGSLLGMLAAPAAFPAIAGLATVGLTANWIRGQTSDENAPARISALARGPGESVGGLGPTGARVAYADPIRANVYSLNRTMAQWGGHEDELAMEPRIQAILSNYETEGPRSLAQLPAKFRATMVDEVAAKYFPTLSPDQAGQFLPALARYENVDLKTQKLLATQMTMGVDSFGAARGAAQAMGLGGLNVDAQGNLLVAIANMTAPAVEALSTTLAQYGGQAEMMDLMGIPAMGTRMNRDGSRSFQWQFGDIARDNPRAAGFIGQQLQQDYAAAMAGGAVPDYTALLEKAEGGWRPGLADYRSLGYAQAQSQRRIGTYGMAASLGISEERAVSLGQAAQDSPQMGRLIQSALSGDPLAMSIAGQANKDFGLVTREASTGLGLFQSAASFVGEGRHPWAAGYLNRLSPGLQAALRGGSQLEKGQLGNLTGLVTPMGGINGLQQYMSDLSYSGQMASLGSSMRQLKLDYAFTTGKGLEDYGTSVAGVPLSQYAGGLWGLQDQQRALSRRQFEAGLGLQGENLAVQRHQFYENWDFNRNQAAVQRGYQQQDFGFQAMQMAQGRTWQREDWAFGEGQRALQYGRGLEDIDDNIRFATGRERKLMARSRGRMTEDFNIAEGRDDTVQGRQEKLWAQEDERFGVQQKRAQEMYDLQLARFDLERHQFEERQALQEAQQGQQLAFFNEREALELKMQDLQRTQYDLGKKEQERALGAQAGIAVKMKEAQDAMAQIGNQVQRVEGRLRVRMMTEAVFYDVLSGYLETLIADVKSGKLSRKTFGTDFLDKLNGGSSGGGKEGNEVAAHWGFKGLVTRETTFRVAEGNRPEDVSITPMGAMRPAAPPVSGAGENGPVNVTIFLDGKEIAAVLEVRQGRSYYHQARR